MVGVSKIRGGCMTCRARKVKCDGRSPCGPCSIKNRECKPYIREYIFIQGGASEGAAIEEPASATAPVHVESEQATYIRQLQNETTELAATLERVTSSNPLYCEQLMNHFVNDYTAIARRDGNSNQLPNITWILHLPPLRGSSETLDAAILALSSAGLGRERRDFALLRNATTAYGRALKKLQTDLYHSRQVGRSETLSACLALILYQILGEYPAKDDWMSHVKGVAELVRMRGAHSYASGIDHILFRSCRINMILGALCTLKPTFLRSDLWRSIPWSLSPKTSYDTLIDEMTVLPNLLACCNDLSQIADDTQKLEQRFALIRDYWGAEKALLQWYENLSEFTKCFSIINDPMHMPGEELGTIAFPHRIEFTSMSAAYIHMLYWASLGVVYNALKLLYQALQGIETTYYWPPHPAALRCKDCFATFDPITGGGRRRCDCGFMEGQSHYDISALPKLTERHDPITTASRICMSVPYCLQQDLKMMGPYYTLFPLKIAIGCFTGHLPSTSLELRYCYKTIDMLEAKGLQFSRKMLGIYDGRTFGGFAG